MKRSLEHSRIIVRASTLALCLVGWVSCTTPPEAHDTASLDRSDAGGDPSPDPPPEPVGVKVAAARPGKPWPPPPLAPLPFVEHPTEDSGKWRPITGLVQQNPGAPPMMVQARIHNRKLRGPKRDRFNAKDRLYEIEVVVWDPEQVSLRFMAGTMEPEAPFHKRGAGRVPRSEAVLSRLVAVFNGGWRTKDTGTSGVMTDRVEGLPPGPNLATIGIYDDGRVEVGTWEKPDKIPEDMHSFRQNTQPLYGEGGYNPQKRVRKWGGTGGVAGADGPFTVRSGICRTQEGYLAYIYGEQMDPIQLAEVMERARCVYGLHLDMNGIHAGFEYFSLSDFAPGPREGPTFKTKAERLTERMYYKPFPRYLDKRPKDFFYLLRTPILPTRFEGMSLGALPQPGSERHNPAAAAGAHASAEGLRAIAWDTGRMPLADKAIAIEGGLQILLAPGAAPQGDKAQLVRSTSGELRVVAEGGASGGKVLLSTAAYKGRATGGKLRVLGASGRSLIYMEAPEDQLGALEAAMASVPGVGWLTLGAEAEVKVRTRATEGGGWVVYDGFSALGEPIEAPDTPPQGALAFGLPAERAMVADLFDGPGEPAEEK